MNATVAPKRLFRLVAAKSSILLTRCIQQNDSS